MLNSILLKRKYNELTIKYTAVLEREIEKDERMIKALLENDDLHKLVKELKQEIRELKSGKKK